MLVTGSGTLQTDYLTVDDGRAGANTYGAIVHGMVSLHEVKVGKRKRGVPGGLP